MESSAIGEHRTVQQDRTSKTRAIGPYLRRNRGDRLGFEAAPLQKKVF
jgi:hypothetical protein